MNGYFNFNFCQFPLDEKLTIENQDSATADICLKNTTHLLHCAENKLATQFVENFQQ
jgi:hypothetical protein